MPHEREIAPGCIALLVPTPHLNKDLEMDPRAIGCSTKVIEKRPMNADDFNIRRRYFTCECTVWNTTVWNESFKEYISVQATPECCLMRIDGNDDAFEEERAARILPLTNIKA